jgi:hypothetical protein
MFSHFGPVEEIDALCDVARSRLVKWADVVHDAMKETEDIDRITQILTERTASEFDEAAPGADLERYEVLSGMRMNAAGLVRYWQKQAERRGESATDAP